MRDGFITDGNEVSSVMRRNPFNELEDMFDRMGRQLETGTLPDLQTVPVDLQDHGETYELVADLPGYEPEDIELTYADGTLEIDAEREETTEEMDEDTGHYVHRERREEVARSVRIPEAVIEAEITASHENGMLTVTLPKETVTEDGHSIDID